MLLYIRNFIRKYGCQRFSPVSVSSSVLIIFQYRLYVTILSWTVDSSSWYYLMCWFAIYILVSLCYISLYFGFPMLYHNGRGGIVVRAHASRAEGLRFEPDSKPWLNARSMFTQQRMDTWWQSQRPSSKAQLFCLSRIYITSFLHSSLHEFARLVKAGLLILNSLFEKKIRKYQEKLSLNAGKS